MLKKIILIGITLLVLIGIIIGIHYTFSQQKEDDPSPLTPVTMPVPSSVEEDIPLITKEEEIQILNKEDLLFKIEE